MTHRGQFAKGHDPRRGCGIPFKRGTDDRRHNFTREDCRRGRRRAYVKIRLRGNNPVWLARKIRDHYTSKRG
jgi:hypothetical protein